MVGKLFKISIAFLIIQVIFSCAVVIVRITSHALGGLVGMVSFMGGALLIQITALLVLGSRLGVWLRYWMTLVVTFYLALVPFLVCLFAYWRTHYPFFERKAVIENLESTFWLFSFLFVIKAILASVLSLGWMIKDRVSKMDH